MLEFPVDFPEDLRQPVILALYEARIAARKELQQLDAIAAARRTVAMEEARAAAQARPPIVSPPRRPSRAPVLASALMTTAKLVTDAPDPPRLVEGRVPTRSSAFQPLDLSVIPTTRAEIAIVFGVIPVVVAFVDQLCTGIRAGRFTTEYADHALILAARPGWMAGVPWQPMFFDSLCREAAEYCHVQTSDPNLHRYSFHQYATLRLEQSREWSDGLEKIVAASKNAIAKTAGADATAHQAPHTTPASSTAALKAPILEALPAAPSTGNGHRPSNVTAATEPPKQYPNRARWLADLMSLNGVRKTRIGIVAGVDKKTIQRILDGLFVEESTLQKLVRNSNHPDSFAKAFVREDIPND
jgi:hypothetical protein